jgi:N-acyl-D-aspartate/D-glutamate deacylase
MRHASGLLCLVFAFIPTVPAPATPHPFTLLVSEAPIAGGLGGEQFGADIGVNDGAIAATGPLGGRRAAWRIEAKEIDAGMVCHQMGEDGMQEIRDADSAEIASGAGVGRLGAVRPHSPGSGNHSPLHGRFLRDVELISLALAERKLTSLPAGTTGFDAPGCVRPGEVLRRKTVPLPGA